VTKTPEYVETFPDGTVIERPWTPEELAQQQKDRDDFAAAQAAQEAAAATATANAAAAIAHAKSLGFTDAMISAMYPALVAPVAP
jgi:hypothetical protein